MPVVFKNVIHCTPNEVDAVTQAFPEFDVNCFGVPFLMKSVISAIVSDNFRFVFETLDDFLDCPQILDGSVKLREVHFMNFDFLGEMIIANAPKLSFSGVRGNLTVRGASVVVVESTVDMFELNVETKKLFILRDSLVNLVSTVAPSIPPRQKIPFWRSTIAQIDEHGGVLFDDKPNPSFNPVHIHMFNPWLIDNVISVFGNVRLTTCDASFSDDRVTFELFDM